MPAAEAAKVLTADAEDPLREGAVSGSLRGSSASEIAVSNCARREDAPRWRRMDKFTKLLVNLAVFAYLPLQVPQIVKNFEAKDHTELKGLAWQGTTTGALGNLLLCTYFTSKHEWPAVRVQAIGAITNFAVVVQIWWAGYCPQVPFFVFSAIMIVGLVIPLLKAMRCLAERVFCIWQEQATTVIGAAALLSLIGSTIVPNNDWVLGGMGLGGALIMIVLLALRPPKLVPLLGKVSAWLATYLFMFMPVPQVVYNFVDHEKAKSFAIGFAVLAAIGNGFCSSRALFTKDAIWFTGAIWGTLIGGWLTAVSVYFAGYLQLLPFILYSVGLFGYLALIMAMNGRALRESPFQQLAFVFFETAAC